MNETDRPTENYDNYIVCITFPEFFTQGTYKFVQNSGQFESPNIITYTENNHLIRIKCLSDKIRQSLVSNQIVYNIIMETLAIPLIKNVKKDILSANNLFLELRSKLVIKGFHEMHFYYEKNGNGYRIFDSYIKIDPQTNEPYRLFQKAMIIKSLPKELVRPGYREIYDIIQSLNIEQDIETEEVYVSSNDLKTSIEDALLVYITADGINSFPIDDVETE
jgi:hypothetical protein